MPGPVSDERAGDLRRRYHLLFGGPTVPVPVESIAEDFLGLSLHESDGLPYSGMLIPASREIWVNAAEHEYAGRPRFTVAHELGHWIHHVIGARDPAPVYCRASDVRPENGAPDYERDANVFAAELLMPEDEVRAQWARAPTIAAVAEAFDVSELAIHWRLYNLGVVGERPARVRYERVDV
jgi:Zn-dependent peptidase ImmA (M78 family)